MVKDELILPFKESGPVLPFTAIFCHLIFSVSILYPRMIISYCKAQIEFQVILNAFQYSNHLLLISGKVLPAKNRKLLVPATYVV